MEARALTVALAKAIAKLTLSRVPHVGDLSDDLVDIVAAIVPTGKGRDARVRQFEEFGASLAIRLEPLIDEADLTTHDKEAVARALANTLDAAQLTPELVIANDEDEVRVRERLAAVACRQGLAPTAADFFELLLTDTAAALATGASWVPEYQHLTNRELLRRLRAISEAFDRGLDDMPKRTGGALKPKAVAANFELAYRRAVANKFDRVLLYGVKADDRVRRYSLSVAYLSLTATSASYEAPSPLDDILAGTDRAIVRGEAGSGKTTLLHWLAVQAAQRTFSGNLRHWNTLTPLYVPLRDAARTGQLPPVSRFVDHGAGVYAGSEPTDWALEVLESKRALVLIDGIDELPPQLLNEISQWLQSLVDAFPECKYVLTSRPAPLDLLSIADLGFAQYTLAPMTNAAVQLFISQWHKAVSFRFATEDDLADVYRLEAALLRNLDNREDLRNMASTPLLCALMCALSWEARGNVPADRVSLYSDAIDLLMHRRDEHRGIAASAPISVREMTVLLEGLAYNMLSAGSASIERPEFHQAMADGLRAMPRVRADHEVVSAFLRTRSGVLVDAGDEAVGFAHLNFRDFLAAKHVVQTKDPRRLLREAAAGRWQEVATFYSSFAAPADVRELFKRLLWEGRLVSADEKLTLERQPRMGREFLALACFAAASVVDRDVFDELTARIGRLVPPKSYEEARLLAAGGEAAVAALRSLPRELSTEAIVHSITMLSAVGDTAAMRALRGWSRHSSHVVRAALVDAWSSFETRSYASLVLDELETAEGEPFRLTVAPAALDCIKRWLWATDVTIIGAVSDLAADELAMSRITRLAIQGWRSRTMNLFSAESAVTTFELADAPQLEQIAGITDVPGLARISVVDAPDWSELQAVADIATLQELIAHHVKTGEPRLTVRAALRRLELSDIAGLSSVSVRAPDALRHVDLARLPLDDLAWLSEASNVETLSVTHSRLTELPPLDRCQHLTEVNLSHTNGISNLTPLQAVRALRKISLSGCSLVADLRPLCDLPLLEELDVSFCPRLVDLAPLVNMPSLRRVDLTGCPSPWDLRPLLGIESYSLPDLPVEAG